MDALLPVAIGILSAAIVVAFQVASKTDSGPLIAERVRGVFGRATPALRRWAALVARRFGRDVTIAAPIVGRSAARAAQVGGRAAVATGSAVSHVVASGAHRARVGAETRARQRTEARLRADALQRQRAEARERQRAEALQRQPAEGRERPRAEPQRGETGGGRLSWIRETVADSPPVSRAVCRVCHHETTTRTAMFCERCGSRLSLPVRRR